ncbi:DUF1893 domain-containing protein [Niameybacter massiliensis]|uniref:DUF1893 domain-containing protein n=1 Tax=Holtiella tumoricola TaxID=3018743 RepID=A0AA42DPW3_9FIRM|nr:DUF1893 domain-containing protein [Holtiella tumoricola]MDA3732641.1 DUF1893 domain-containing protein [Holtiella tumoricola]
MTREALKTLLNEQEASCILFENGQMIMNSYEKGVLPLWRYITECESLPEGILEVADKMVGRAVAYLLIYLGVSNVYTKVISKTALEVLSRYAMTVHYDEVVPYILNRTKDGQCPMEAALEQVGVEQEAFKIIDQFVKRRLGIA